MTVVTIRFRRPPVKCDTCHIVISNRWRISPQERHLLSLKGSMRRSAAARASQCGTTELNGMKSYLVSISCSLVVSLLVADITLNALGMPRDPGMMLAIVAISSMLLYERGLAELGIIGAISLFAQLNAQGLGSQAVAPDIMCALVIALVVMPFGMRALGFEPPRSTSSHTRVT